MVNYFVRKTTSNIRNLLIENAIDLFYHICIQILTANLFYIKQGFILNLFEKKNSFSQKTKIYNEIIEKITCYMHFFSLFISAHENVNRCLNKIITNCTLCHPVKQSFSFKKYKIIKFFSLNPFKKHTSLHINLYNIVTKQKKYRKKEENCFY